MKDAKKSYVFDTNVFLADPLAIYAFPGSNILIPDVVLSELDRLKTSKLDKRLRYRGRQISRILFSLSEKGVLLEGIPIEEGSVVRVVALDQSADIPVTLNPKNTDDRILACARQAAGAGEEVTIVTNDLNMLLKAQTLKLPVVRYGEDDERSFASRLAQGIKRNRAVAAAALVGVVALALALYALGVSTSNNGSQPVAFPQQSPQAKEFQYRQALQKNPGDVNAWIGLGNLYFSIGEEGGSSEHLRQAVDFYVHALEIEPDNADVRTDMAIAHFYLKQVDKAIEEAKLAIKANPKHALAHLNLGVFYFKGKKDDVNAVRELNAAIRLDKTGKAAARARELLQEIRMQERQGGK